MEENLNGLFSGVTPDDESMGVFDNKTKNQDGIYRPKLEDALDKKTYISTIRFLPNITPDGKIGASAIEKYIHYVKLQDDELAGYYDCAKNLGPKCPICTNYWKFDNSSNASEKEKAKLIGRTAKYYSYVLIIEDKQNRDLEGKIMVFPYGSQIKNKINSERTGEVTGEKVNIFDLSRGKDMKLIIKEKGGYANYESSQFLESSPIKLYSEKAKKFVTAPVDEEGNISDEKVTKKILSFLRDRGDINIEDNKAVEWDDETKIKVEKIIARLNGKDFDVENSANKSSNDYVENDGDNVILKSTHKEADSFFELDDDDE